MFDPCIAHQIQAPQVHDLRGFFFGRVSRKSNDCAALNALVVIFLKSRGNYHL